MHLFTSLQHPFPLHPCRALIFQSLRRTPRNYAGIPGVRSTNTFRRAISSSQQKDSRIFEFPILKPYLHSNPFSIPFLPKRRCTSLSLLNRIYTPALDLPLAKYFASLSSLDGED
ncbi:hypothetical protein TNIN_268021 [Trichonephila inaurata madagascariensis]|uniref:Uncharacterized protein n=1 Tax=Trichonephila inaurata madagascariensis TaxID=2747483 RepID=A0A8X6XRA7_9ARAC|nr:hypothetical protein TNIN_268021 [Trichonephila inaurata madagascariensis]